MNPDQTPPPAHDPSDQREPRASTPTSTPTSLPGDAYHGMEGKTWALLSHLLGLLGYAGNGIGSIIGPLVLWLVKKDAIPEVAAHAKEALNFNIAVAIYGVSLFLLTLGSFFLLMPLTFVAGVALMIFHVVCIVIASIKANNGELWRYPLTLRLVK